jgi:DNA-binding NarL/FixJ family response regulator
VTIRLLVVDEHVLIRLGLTRAVEDCLDITVVGEAASAAAASAAVDRYRPTVVTFGLMLPDGDGILAAQRLRQRVPDLGVVLLSAMDDEAVLLRALDAGLSGYLPKTASTPAVLAAIRHAATAPHTFTSPTLAGALRSRREHTGLLSQREQEVLRLMRDGTSVPRIAGALGVRESTVKTYVGRIYEKLNVNNRSQALMAALHQGLLAVDADAA